MAKQEIQFLKKRIQARPNDQMAWYLLGQQYRSIGEQRKANYCFVQSGPIYEAYEQTRLPKNVQQTVVHLDELAEEKQEDNRDKSRWPVRRSLIGLVIVLLILIPSGAFHTLQTKQFIEDEPTQMNQAVVHHAVHATNSSPSPEEFAVIEWTRSIEEGANDVVSLLSPSTLPAPMTSLVKATYSLDASWVEWVKPFEPLLTATIPLEGDSRSIYFQYYDEEICACEPDSPELINEWLDRWKREQEELLILHSAVAAYVNDYARLPTGVADITGDYPNNRLSGMTSFMEEAFSSILQEFEHGTHQRQDLESRSELQIDSTWTLQQPLEIVIDKSKYRLALISENVIIRSYPIGLGGVETPEEEYVISEKVINPNGRSDGEFGSRGMTLSDTLYAIHGTNDPDSIGKDESLGCIRMLNDDLEELFAFVTLGTKVTITAESELPADIQRAEERLSLPLLNHEENPNKVYRWLR